MLANLFGWMVDRRAWLLIEANGFSLIAGYVCVSSLGLSSSRVKKVFLLLLLLLLSLFCCCYCWFCCCCSCCCVRARARACVCLCVYVCVCVCVSEWERERESTIDGLDVEYVKMSTGRKPLFLSHLSPLHSSALLSFPPWLPFPICHSSLSLSLSFSLSLSLSLSPELVLSIDNTPFVRFEYYFPAFVAQPT